MTGEKSTAARSEEYILKAYRRELWRPFIEGIKQYELVGSGDRIAVCVSGGKDSMLTAKLMQLLHRTGEVRFDLEFIAMDPGYSPEHRRLLEANAELLGIPLKVFETDIFGAVDNTEKSPCYLCARMRRGHLYSQAQKLGCNKIALGHHFDDVVETTLIGMFYGSQLQAMIPKVKSENFPGMELIRPIYCVHEEDISVWGRAVGVEFLRCACRAAEKADADASASKRQTVKLWLRNLSRDDPDIEKRIFRSIHSVWLDTFPAYKTKGETHSFLENYDKE